MSCNCNNKTIHVCVQQAHGKTSVNLGGYSGSYTRARYDTTAGWNSNPSFIPKCGEMVVYSDYQERTDAHGDIYYIPGIKVGDGTTYLIDLPFVNDSISEDIIAILESHINNTDIHVSTEEKQLWNNKLNCTINNEELIFNRL